MPYRVLASLGVNASQALVEQASVYSEILKGLRVAIEAKEEWGVYDWALACRCARRIVRLSSPTGPHPLRSVHPLRASVVGVHGLEALL